MEKIKLLMLILTICLCVGGCQKSDTADTAISSKKKEFTCPAEINQKLTDNISVNAKVNIPESAKDGRVQVLDAKPHDFISQKEELQQMIGNIGDDNLSDGYLDWSSDYAIHVSNTINLDSEYEGYNGNLYQTDNDLSFMSKAEALKKVKSALSQLGVEVDENNESYVLDYTIMKEQENVTNAFGEEKKENKKEQWTEADNGYYFRFKHTYDGILIAEDYAPYNSMEVIYNKDGIQAICILNYYDITQKGKEVDIITVEDAIEKIKNKYSAVISENKITITDIEFCMKIMNGGIEGNKAAIVPAWKFQVMTDEEGTETPIYSENVLINAETGKEIL